MGKFCILLQLRENICFMIIARIPKNLDVVKRWKKELGIDEKSGLRGRICVEHFSQDDLIINKKGT